MNTLDLLLLGIIGLSALFGAVRGFVGVVASVVAWIGAGWCAFHYGAELGFWFSDDGMPGPTELLAGYVAAFLAVVVLVGLVGWCVRRLLHAIGLSGMDRLLGLVLGTLRGALVACVAVVLMAFSALPREPAWKQSVLLPVLLPGAQWMSLWLPPWAAAQLDFGNGTAARDNGASQRAGAVIGTIVGGLPVPLDGDEPIPGAEAEPSPPNPGQ